MSKCKFILKLPGGESIVLPASFGTIEPDESINKAFSEYNSAEEDIKKEKLKDLANLINSKIDNSLHGNTIKSIISKSPNIDILYENVNNNILQLGTYENVEQAVYEYIKSGSNKDKKWSKNENLEKLLNGLQQERTPKYFSNIGIDGVVGTTNFRDEKNRIYAKDIENREFGFSNAITSNLNSVLNALINKYPESKLSNILYGTNNAFIGKAWSDGDMVLYNLDDDLSLFLGLFKREAKNINKAELVPILQEINKITGSKFKTDSIDLDSFFIGEFTNKKLSSSEFEKLLEKTGEFDISKQLNRIVELVADSIKPEDYSLRTSMKKLFWLLNPATYGKNMLFKQVNDIKLATEEEKIGINYKNERMSFLDMTEETLPLNFSPVEIIDNNYYQKAIENIVPNKDLVKFPIEKSKISIYGLVTNIFKRENGVAIYGVRKNKEGKVETLKYTFKFGDDLEYRKRESEIDPYIAGETIIENNGIAITSETPMNTKMIKSLIRKGDKVNGNLVIGIYPGYLLLKTPSKGNVYNKYKNIKSIISSIALDEELSSKGLEISKMVKVSDSSNLSAGDYFLHENGHYRKVIYSDQDNIYSWIPGKEGTNGVIKPIKKSSIKSGLRGAYGELNLSDIKKLQEEINFVGRSEATMSTFSDINNAKEGDFFIAEYGDSKKYGKVLNDNKVLLSSINNITERTVESIENLKNPKFFTTRDISGNFYLYISRVNSWNLTFDKSENLNKALYDKLEYVVPKGTALKSLVMLPNGYANIGRYSIPSKIKANEEIITDNILEALDKVGLEVFAEKTSPNSMEYVRNTDSLTQINYFDKLPQEIKEELDVIQPGTYFSVYNSSDSKYGIDYNIYRVMSVDGDIVKAHLNKLSNTGNILTIEREFSKKDLLNSNKNSNGSSMENSIARLYLQNGNSKMSAAIRETNKLDRDLVNKSINTLINKFKKYIGDLDIEIKLVDAKGNFENNQKAKLTTTEDGKTAILINNELGQTEDVLHEFLHLFLTPLRYKHPEIYDALIKSVVKSELNVTDAEEEFVKFVSSEMGKNGDFIESFSDFSTFVNGLKSIVKLANEEYSLTSSDNPVDLLSIPLVDLFDINTNDNTNPLYELGLITTEPMMREWMKNNNITLNCN